MVTAPPPPYPSAAPQPPAPAATPTAPAAAPGTGSFLGLLPPPEDRLYATFQDLHDDLKAWCRQQGYAMTIGASCNRDHMGVYRRYNLSCSRGGKVIPGTSTGLRRVTTHKTGCRMRIKAIQTHSWPWDNRWHIKVIEAKHNHGPFTGAPGEDVPPQFRKLEPDGIRWLLIMHREAKCTIRQLTIGLRLTFGDKYKYVQKSDVSNMLARIRRGEEKELASRPPGAPPLAPGAMTAFTAAILTPSTTTRHDAVQFQTLDGPSRDAQPPPPIHPLQPSYYVPGGQRQPQQPQHQQPYPSQGRPPYPSPSQQQPSAGQADLAYTQGNQPGPASAPAGSTTATPSAEVLRQGGSAGQQTPQGQAMGTTRAAFEPVSPEQT
ncbi:hypothetical protein VTK73DRAFT_8578 [Phialemonium thermophilum]|uniref:FAR1 domain-containing protein n=1 Tax=Phialemonium thermophilum TaxID=223376 RepID=A0ABR3W7S8_9PEZI